MVYVLKVIAAAHDHFGGGLSPSKSERYDKIMQDRSSKSMKYDK